MRLHDGDVSDGLDLIRIVQQVQLDEIYNLVVQSCALRDWGTRKVRFQGLICIYPKLASQLMREEHLLTGALEPTNEWCVATKIASIEICQAYPRQPGFAAISTMPVNLYSPDPGLVRRGSPSIEETGAIC